MISQEYRRQYQTIRPAEYAGKLDACRRCGADPQLFVIDPVGTWIRYVVPKGTTFYAVRCGCGETGALRQTGRTANGFYIDDQRAAEQAGEAWNAEQEGLTSNASVRTDAALKGEAL